MSAIPLQIEQKIRACLAPVHLVLQNESGKHNVPTGSESHFRLLLVSERFLGLTRLDRHKLMHDLLADEFKSGLHALSLNLYTPDEWQRQEGASPATPPCLGNKKT